MRSCLTDTNDPHRCLQRISVLQPVCLCFDPFTETCPPLNGFLQHPLCNTLDEPVPVTAYVQISSGPFDVADFVALALLRPDFR